MPSTWSGALLEDLTSSPTGVVVNGTLPAPDAAPGNISDEKVLLGEAA